MTTFPLEMEGVLPLAQTEDQIDFWKKLRPVNIPAATDTYKRTMAEDEKTFGSRASYILAARKGLKEPGANGRLIMAGLESVLYPWFGLPVTEREVRKAEGRFMYASEIDCFPKAMWEGVLANDGFQNVDIWGFPGGQTFRVDEKLGKHVPLMSVEGPGALASHYEPTLTGLFSPIIAATKARLMREAVGEKFAEFGYRSAKNFLDHIVLMHAIRVGGNYRYTSNDQAVFLFPEAYTSIGTMGHEFLQSYQRLDGTLEEAQELACRDFVGRHKKSALLPDLIDTVKSGLPLILKLVQEYKVADPSKIIMPRFDSGDIESQVLTWKKMTLDAGFAKTSMVVEDGFTPERAAAIKKMYASYGYDPEEIIVGAGGYFQENNERDTISMAYKRSSTLHEIMEPCIKLSDSPGKLSIPGPVRVYGRGSTMVVALAGEKIEGEPLYVQLVKNGRIMYHETLKQQAERAEATWKTYDSIEYSPKVQEIMRVRMRERDGIRERLAA